MGDDCYFADEEHYRNGQYHFLDNAIANECKFPLFLSSKWFVGDCVFYDLRVTFGSGNSYHALVFLSISCFTLTIDPYASSVSLCPIFPGTDVHILALCNQFFCCLFKCRVLMLQTFILWTYDISREVSNRNVNLLGQFVNNVINTQSHKFDDNGHGTAWNGIILI